MADAWNSLRVREFEHVLAGPTVALLRVSGRPVRRRLTTGSRPVLLADDGQAIRRFAAIPAPPDERGVLRAAYSVTADLVATSTSFSLELVDGTVIALPAPRPGRARLIPEPADNSASEAAEAAEAAQPPEPPEGIDERRSDLVSKLTRLSASVAESEQARGELERLVASSKEASEALEHELVGARERAARAEAEAKKSAVALEELETWRAELERRLTETTDELRAARTARTHDKGAVLRLGTELAEAEAKAELLQAQVEILDNQLAGVTAAPVDARLAPDPYSPSEREVIAEQAGELVALPASAEHLTDPAGEVAEARVQAEILYATASAEPSAAHPAAEDSLAVARAEIDDLRAQLAQAREGETQARIETLRHAAETEARELAERELEFAQAAPADE